MAALSRPLSRVCNLNGSKLLPSLSYLVLVLTVYRESLKSIDKGYADGEGWAKKYIEVRPLWIKELKNWGNNWNQIQTQVPQSASFSNECQWKAKPENLEMFQRWESGTY